MRLLLPAAMLCAALLTGGLTSGVLQAQARGQAQTREIVQIRGDLYYIRGCSHNTVFLVTPAGIILGDPISTDIANWLKPELERRFHTPVRYIVYSHHDFDHAGGAAVFGAAAQVVAHENVLNNLGGQLQRLAGAIAEGRTLEELKKSVTLDKYNVWPNFATAGPNHIEAACTNLRDFR